MTLDHTIRNAIGKTLAAGAALYVGICGLPGLAGKEDVQVSQQPPAAEQQVQGSYLEQAANELFVREKAYAENSESCKDEISINQYWNAANPVNDPELPETTRTISYENDSLCREGTIEPSQRGKLNGGHWSTSDNFKEVYFNSEQGNDIKNVFNSHGINLNNFGELLSRCSDEIGVGIYDKGYLVILDNNQQKGYVIKTDTGISTQIGREVYGAK